MVAVIVDRAAEAEDLIRGSGTSLAAWQNSLSLASVEPITHQQLVPMGQRLVVVAPHPDDEVLGCAGILSGMKGREADVLMVAVTDGEASHPGSVDWTPSRLGQQRPLESRQALDLLGLNTRELNWRRMRLPDTGVAGQADRLVERLLEIIRPGDRVITTWRRDGHCDHESTGGATARVVAQQQAFLIEVPIWAWHWARPEDPRIPWIRARKFMLDAQVLARKRSAIHAHVSQVSKDGGAPAVLECDTLERLLQPFELVFV